MRKISLLFPLMLAAMLQSCMTEDYQRPVKIFMFASLGLAILFTTLGVVSNRNKKGSGSGSMKAGAVFTFFFVLLLLAA